MQIIYLRRRRDEKQREGEGSCVYLTNISPGENGDLLNDYMILLSKFMWMIIKEYKCAFLAIMKNAENLVSDFSSIRMEKNYEY